MAFIKQIKVGNNTYDIHKKVTVTIAAADWTAATIDKTVSGMTVNDIVVVSPAPSSIIGARNSVVYCSAIKAGALSFTYSVSKPTAALTFNVLWVQAATTDTNKGAIINTVMGGKIPTGTLNVSSTLSNYDTYLHNVRYINLGAGSLNVSGSAISSVSGSGSVNPGTNTISKNSATNVSTGTVTTTKPTSGVYVAVDAATAQGSGNINISASGTAKAGVTTAGYVHNETASSTISKSGTASVTVPAKSAATTYIPINAGTIDVTDKTVTPNALNGAWDATNEKYVVSQAKKTGETMQSTVTTAGYVSSTVGTKNTGALTINAPANLEIAKATCSVTRDSAPSATIAKNPTATTTASSATTSVTGMKTTTTNTGYIVSASATSGSASAASGYSTASVGAIYDTHTAGYLPNKAKTKIFDAATATATEKTAHSDAKTASETKYIQKGVLGATVNGNITFTPSVSTNMATISKPSSGTEGRDYFSITGSGTKSGTVTGKASVSTEGYVKSETATGGSATGTIGSDAKKYVKKATITNNTSGGTSPKTINRGKQIKIGAGYNPSDLYYIAEAAPTLSGNAAAANVLSDKTFYSDSYTKHTGTMANNGSTGGTISTKAGTISIPAGYTTGGSVSISTTEQNKIVAGNIKKGVTVLGVAGTYTSDATATAANILSDKTAYVNGAKISGTMANRGLVSPTLGLGQSYILEEGYYEGGEILVIPGQAKSPTEITVGTAITPDTGYGLSSVTIPSNATITVGEENKLNITVPCMSSPMVTYSSESNEGGESTILNATVGGTSLNILDIKDEATASVTIFSGSLNISRISGIVHSEDLISSNIRKGSSILGVVGTYTASSTASDIYKAQYAGNISSNGWSIYWYSFEGNMGSNWDFTENLSTPIPQGASVRLKYNEFGPNANSGAGFKVYLVSAGGTTQLIANPSAYEAVNGPHTSSEITSNIVATKIKVEKSSAAGETVSTYQSLAVEVYANVPSGYYGVTATNGGSTLADISSYQYMAVKKAALGKTYTPSTSTQYVTVSGEGWVKTSNTVATINPISTETQTVNLSLASGNQTVHATDGKYMTSVTINKPSTLVAGNIKNGVNIAGVTGTYSAPPAADPAVKFLGLYLYTQRGSAANIAVLENVTDCQFAGVNRIFGEGAYVGCFGLFAFKGTPTTKPCLFDADGMVIGESSAVPLSALLNDPYASRNVSLYDLLNGITKYEQNINYNQIYLAPMALTTNANDWGPSSPYYWQASGIGDSSSTYVYIKNLGSRCMSLNYND